METETKVSIWMPFYVADYKADTARLSTIEHGAYLLIILDYWRNGPIPDNDEIIRRITGLGYDELKEMKPLLKSFFTVKGGRWRHKRIDKELEKATKNRSTAKEKARKAANIRWGNDAPSIASSTTSSSASSKAQALLKDSPSPSSSPVPSDKRPVHVDESTGEVIWGSQ